MLHCVLIPKAQSSSCSLIGLCSAVRRGFLYGHPASHTENWLGNSTCPVHSCCPQDREDLFSTDRTCHRLTAVRRTLEIVEDIHQRGPE